MVNARAALEEARDTLTERLSEIVPQPEGVTRPGQIAALGMLPIVIIVNLAVLVAVRSILESLILQSLTGSGLTVFSFFVTGTMLALVVASAWFWFVWVRTAGVGLFAV